MAKKKKATGSKTAGERGALRRAKNAMQERASTAYVEIRGSEKVAFAKAERGRFIKTHVAAAYHDCTLCGARRGNACFTQDEDARSPYLIRVHVERRQTYYAALEDEVHAFRKKALGKKRGQRKTG